MATTPTTLSAHAAAAAPTSCRPMAAVVGVGRIGAIVAVEAAS